MNDWRSGERFVVVMMASMVLFLILGIVTMDLWPSFQVRPTIGIGISLLYVSLATAFGLHLERRAKEGQPNERRRRRTGRGESVGR